MPPITRSDTPYPLRTLDGTVDLEVDDMVVNGTATFNGTVNIPGGVPAGPQPYFIATDATNQYRTNNGDMQFKAFGVETTYTFKNTNENTENNIIIAGKYQGNGNKDEEILTTQINTNAGTQASAGFKSLSGAASLDVLVGSASNIPLGNRGVVRTASAAGLDIQATGAGRNIRFKTDAGTRIEVNDTATLVSTNLTATSGTASTNTTTGAVVVTGGVGVSGAVNAGSVNATTLSGEINTPSPIRTTNTTNSTSPGTGALITDGGLGVNLDTTCGGNVKAINFKGAYGDTYQSDPALTNTKLLGTAFSTPIADDATYLFTPGNSATSSSSYVLGVNTLGLVIPATTESSSTLTGGITTPGGVGIGKNLYVGGVINASSSTAPVNTSGTIISTNATPSTNSITGACVITGGVGIGENLNVQGNINATQMVATVNTPGTITTSNTTASTDSTTGALKVAGGAGVVGNLNVGGNIGATLSTAPVDTTGTIRSTNAAAATDPFTGAVVSGGGLGVAGKIFCGGNVKAINYEGAYGDTYNSDPALTNTKLLGTAFSAPLNLDATYLYTPGNSANASSSYVLGVNTVGMTIPATTNATSTSTGAIVTPGGVGIAKDVWVGGNINLAGSLITPAAGTFTPSFKNSGFSVTYTSQVGEYYTLGRLTYVAVKITTTSAIDNVASNLTVQGLPVSSTSTVGTFGNCILVKFGIPVSTDFVSAAILPGAPNEIVFKSSRDNLVPSDVVSPTTVDDRELYVAMLFIS